jgi:hypothetical protein
LISPFIVYKTVSYELIVLLLNCSIAISQAGIKYVEETDKFELCFTTAYARVNVVHLVHIENIELQSHT